MRTLFQVQAGYPAQLHHQTKADNPHAPPNPLVVGSGQLSGRGDAVLFQEAGMVRAYSPHIFNRNSAEQRVSVWTGEQIEDPACVGCPLGYPVGNLRQRFCFGNAD